MMILWAIKHCFGSGLLILQRKKLNDIESIIGFSDEYIMTTEYCDSDKAETLWRKFLRANDIASVEDLSLSSNDFHLNSTAKYAIAFADGDKARLWQSAIDSAYNNLIEDLRSLSQQGFLAEKERLEQQRIEQLQAIERQQKIAFEKRQYIKNLTADSDLLCIKNNKETINFCEIDGDVLNKVVVKKGFKKYKSTTFYVPFGVKSINFYAFSRVKTIKHIVLPSTVEVVNYNAFSGNKYIESVTMQSVKSIGDFAFSGCKNLKFMFVGGVEFIGEHAFLLCENLKFYSSLHHESTDWNYAWDSLTSEGDKKLEAYWLSNWVVLNDECVPAGLIEPDKT